MRPDGVQDLPPPDVERGDPLLLSRLLDVVARNGKSVPKFVRNVYDSVCTIFLLRSILRSPDARKGQIWGDVIFLRKCTSISDTVVGRRVRKKYRTALELLFRRMTSELT